MKSINSLGKGKSNCTKEKLIFSYKDSHPPAPTMINIEDLKYFILLRAIITILPKGPRHTHQLHSLMQMGTFTHMENGQQTPFPR